LKIYKNYDKRKQDYIFFDHTHLVFIKEKKIWKAK
jgi:hypothetical protein